MKSTGRSGWKNESRRHSLARKGIKTNIGQGRRFDVSRFVANGQKLPEVDISRHNWTFRINPDGTMKLSLGNMSDGGWYWSGDESELALFLYRIMNSSVKEQFIEDMKDEGITYKMLLPIILKSTESSDGNGMYALTGDYVRWKFEEGYDPDVVDAEIQYLKDNYGLSEKDIDGIMEEYEWESEWNNMSYYEFEKSREFGEIKKKFIHEIKKSHDFEDFDANIKNFKEDVMGIMHDYDLEEGYEHIDNAFNHWRDKQSKKGRIIKEKNMKASGVKDYKVTSRKPKGFGTTRDGYKSDRTGKYYSWINTEGDLL